MEEEEEGEKIEMSIKEMEEAEMNKQEELLKTEKFVLSSIDH